MPVLSYSNATFQLDIDTSQALTANNSAFWRLVSALTEFHETIPLASVKVKLQVPGEWKYTIETASGLKWVQTLFPVGSGANTCEMTFNVMDHWKLADFTPHRGVRDAVVNLFYSHGLQDLKVTFF